MSGVEISVRKKPGIVIFVAVINFFWAAFFLMLSVFFALAIVFGAAWGVDGYVSHQMAQYSASPNFSYGLAIVLGVVSAFFFVLALFFLTLGVGLVRGKAYAWYMQVAMSTLGLLGLPLSVTGLLVLPLGAVINIAILIIFFQNPVRNYFRI